jgi:hypothetical protein
MLISRSLTTANKTKRNPVGKVAGVFSTRMGLEGLRRNSASDRKAIPQGLKAQIIFGTLEKEGR